MADHDILIVGSGFAGLGMAIALKRAGKHDFAVLERAQQVGGTWRENTYPGCACDVPAPLYSYSFAPNPDWSHIYARDDELRAYLEDCAERFGVRPHIRFGAEVTAAQWEADAAHWRLELADGSEVTARLLVAGLGGLNQPAVPEIPGLGEFEGPAFHSARWDHGVELQGKRVAVIGTGASAIQIVPKVAKLGGHVDVYQRTPPWIFPRIDRRISAREKALYRRVPILQKALRGTIFMLQEAIAYPITKRPQVSWVLEWAARGHLRRQVRDPELRRRLTPAYRAGCKRMLVSNDYLPALERANVELVTDGIARIAPDGVISADGHHRAADVLVFGTGFDIERAFRRIRLVGRDGLELADAWADGIAAHRGTAIAGFPNLFMLSGPNTGTGSTSQVFMIESQIHYVLEAMRVMGRRGAATVEVREQAQDDYNAWLQGRMARTVWLTGGCQSWYLDKNGRNGTLFPGFSLEFKRSLRDFVADEYLLEPAPARAPVFA